MTVKFNEMAELVTLMNTDIPEGRNNLLESHANLERVAEYCEGNYLQAEDKTAALEETKNYMTQSLASVAYQINTLAYSFLQMLDLQSAQMSEMEVQISHINQMVMIHKEKVARREIGVLTTNKCSTRQYKILAPANQERPIKYVRRPIDFSILDDIGHGVRVPSELPRQKQRASSQGSTSSLIGPPGGSPQPMTGTLKGHSPVPPAPTSKPPTPPQLRAVGTGSLTKGSREYRTPPAVAPPQVPSNYAPNYPIGHPRRDRNSSGYRTLPMPVNSMGANATYAPSQPQVGMVHPMAHAQGSMTLRESGTYGTGLERQRSYSNPPPPSPGVLVGDMSDYGMELPPETTRPVSMSPPPPPPPIEEELMRGGAEQIYAPGVRRGVLPADEDLPGWVPKNYIEKVVALYDYYADKEDELSFQENSVIYVLRKNDDGWWEGVMDGITGLFPGNYVEPCM